MKRFNKRGVLLCLVLMATINIRAQSPHGNPLARAKNFHSGNKIRTTFYNYGLVGRMLDAADDIGGEWPIGSTHEYIGDVSILVGAEIVPLGGGVKHSVVTSFGPRGGNEMSGDTFWGWEPLSGYASDDTTLVAMSHMGPPADPADEQAVNTWPDFWPDKMDDANDPGWPGSWNGYFGKGQKNAEQESFFVMDDASDAEFQWFPDSLDLERRGLGLNATVRGLQWNHILAEDVLFWLYDIKNIGHKNYSKMVFGAIVGTITGGDGDTQDDYADFNKVDDIAYSYDHGTDLETGLGGIGAGGWTPVGIAGYAFLESPGNALDGIDNDGDGREGSGDYITRDMFSPVSYSPGEDVVVIDYADYSRKIIPMPSEQLVIPYNGNALVIRPNVQLEETPRNLIDDNLNGLIDENDGASIEIAPGFFEEVYLNEGLKYINYLTGEGLDNPMIDESREDGIDNDGDWNAETDDVGLDGAPGSGDILYGEQDGLPTSGAGTNLPGEPHIDKTDVDESDQIGLSSFFFFKYGVGPQMNDDRQLWEDMNPGFFNKSVQNTDADFIFGSGYFPLLSGETERFSLALVFGDNLPDIIRNKQTVQTIYNQNYNFAKAPDLPTVHAYAGDGYVTLYWDDKAEHSYDNLSGYDFEGYKIYKATDTQFSDAGAVTDAFGSQKFAVPVKQFDLNNEHSGFFPIGVDGAQFYLGDNTGLVHTWTDTAVINGHRYFYAVTAYDHGLLEKSILPAETAKFVTIDKGGNIQKAVNVVSVIPEAPSAGYVAPPERLTVKPVGNAMGTGTITARYLDYNRVKSGHVYRIYFRDSRQNGVDDDGDWIPYWDIPNGLWDSTEAFVDLGLDGLPDSLESGPFYYPDGSTGFGGYDPYLNPDPSHDNYAPSTNCGDYIDNDGDGEIDEENESGECDDLGTQFNGQIDWIDEDGDGLYQSTEEGEPFTDFGNGVRDPDEPLRDDVGADGVPDTYDDGENDGIPTPGEPNIDYMDIEESIPVTTHFMVMDVTEFGNPDTVVRWTRDLDGDLAIFHGLQFIIDNDWTVRKRKDATGFSPRFEKEYSLTYAPFEFAGFESKGVPFPRDATIIFSDSPTTETESIALLRTNGSVTAIPSTRANFRIIDPRDDSEIPFAFIDQSFRYVEYDSAGNTILDSVFATPGHLSKWDRIILLEHVADTTIVTWTISVTSGEDSSSTIHSPGSGDTLNFRLFKPFTSEDVFEFVASKPHIDEEKLRSDAHRVKVVPNPYVAAASWEGQNPFATGRGPRSIHFTHLPPQCEIRIYDLVGELVDVIKHDTWIDDGTAEWDLLTKEGLDIAYGIYLYYVSPLPGSPHDFRPVLGKFAVIK